MAALPASVIEPSPAESARREAAKLLVAHATRRRAIYKKLALLWPELLASWRPRSPQQRELLAKVKQLLAELGLDKPKAKRIQR